MSKKKKQRGKEKYQQKNKKQKTKKKKKENKEIQKETTKITIIILKAKGISIGKESSMNPNEKEIPNPTNRFA